MLQNLLFFDAQTLHKYTDTYKEIENFKFHIFVCVWWKNSKYYMQTQNPFCKIDCSIFVLNQKK